MKLDSPAAIAALIDHTLLKPEAERESILQLCSEAVAASFASVCVNPYWVPLASERLAGAPVKVCTVIGFPLGANRKATKVAESRIALADGAQELDMVLNVGALRSGDAGAVESEIAELAHVAHGEGAILKVILETCLLSEDQKVAACHLARAAGADFVKTSTGFSKAGASEADIRLMRSLVGPEMGVKASGGVRNLAALRTMVTAGANRIGTSSGVAILREVQQGEREGAGSGSESSLNAGVY